MIGYSTQPYYTDTGLTSSSSTFLMLCAKWKSSRYHFKVFGMTRPGSQPPRHKADYQLSHYAKWTCPSKVMIWIKLPLWTCSKLRIIMKRSFLLFFGLCWGFNDTSTLEGHFVSSPREREKRDRRDSRRDEREGQGRKRNRNESKETEETKTFPLYPYLLQG